MFNKLRKAYIPQIITRLQKQHDDKIMRQMRAQNSQDVQSNSQPKFELKLSDFKNMPLDELIDDYLTEELEHIEKSNRKDIENIFKKFQNSYRNGRDKDKWIDDPTLPEFYYQQSKYFIKDMKQNYNYYFKNGKNLLLDIQHQNLNEDKILETIYKKTTFKPQDYENSNFRDTIFSDHQGSRVSSPNPMTPSQKRPRSSAYGKDSNQTQPIAQNPSRKTKKIHNSAQGDDDCCFVCGDGDYEDDNLIVYCGKCNISSHQKCYGIDNLDDDVDWICNNCQAFGQESGLRVQCALCMQIGGAMRPVNYKRIDYASKIHKNKSVMIGNPQQLKQFFTEVDYNIRCSQILKRESLAFELNNSISNSQSKSPQPADQIINEKTKEESGTEPFRLKLERSKNQEKIQTQYIWVHQNCGLWQSFQCPIIEVEMVFDVKQFDYRNCLAECEFCKNKLEIEINRCTPKYKCQESQCWTNFHIECARRNQRVFEIESIETGYKFTPIYCKQHEFQKKNRYLQEIKQAKEHELSIFAKNMKQCLRNNFEIKDAIVRKEMGIKYKMLYEPDTIKPKQKAYYNAQTDKGDLVRKCLRFIYEYNNTNQRAAQKKKGDSIDEKAIVLQKLEIKQKLQWGFIRKQLPLIESSFRYKNFDGPQAFREFKKIVSSEEKYDQLFDLFYQETQADKIISKLDEVAFSQSITADHYLLGKRKILEKQQVTPPESQKKIVKPQKVKEQKFEEKQRILEKRPQNNNIQMSQPNESILNPEEEILNFDDPKHLTQQQIPQNKNIPSTRKRDSRLIKEYDDSLNIDDDDLSLNSLDYYTDEDGQQQRIYFGLNKRFKANREQKEYLNTYWLNRQSTTSSEETNDFI
eukprot:403344481